MLFFILKEAPNGNYTTGVAYNDSILGTGPINGNYPEVYRITVMSFGQREYRELS
jgi:hypothetical protein